MLVLWKAEAVSFLTCWLKIHANKKNGQNHSSCTVLLICKPLYGPNILNINISHEVEYELVVSACVVPGRVTLKAWRNLWICKCAAAEQRILSNFMSDPMYTMCWYRAFSTHTCSWQLFQRSSKSLCTQPWLKVDWWSQSQREVMTSDFVQSDFWCSREHKGFTTRAETVVY